MGKTNEIMNIDIDIYVNELYGQINDWTQRKYKGSTLTYVHRKRKTENK